MNEPAVNLENKLKVSLILTPELNTVWKECEQILKKSCKRSDGRVRTVDIYYRIARNLSQLWIIFDDDDLSIVSCLVTNIHTYPTGLKMLNNLLAEIPFLREYKTSNATNNPSPVVANFPNIICPDCSPPRLKLYFLIFSFTYLSPT